VLGADTRSSVNARLLGSAGDTLKAEVAGRVKPTVKCLTKGADWKTKRKAEGLSDFIDATFRAPQGDYQNTWCLGVELFQDMLTFSEGWVEISSQLVDEKTSTYEITHSRQFPWEMFVDENEARYGRPRNLYRVTEMSVDDALSRFVDNAEGIDKEEAQRRRAAIISAEDADDFGQRTTVTRMIKVAEAWHLKRGNSPGRHIICVSDACLFDEEWDRERFPFARMRYEPQRIVYWSHSMIEQGESLAIEYNENLARLSNRVHLMANVKTFFEDGSIDADKLTNAEGQLIPVRPGAQLPQQAKLDPIAPSELGYLRELQSLFFLLVGVSEMKAGSKKDPGLDSGAAIREANDLQSGRFAIVAEGYERLYVDIALCDIDEARMITRRNGKVTVRTAKRGEIDFKTVELPERQVDITSHPASALSSDPGQRLAMAQELFGAGLISGPVFMRLVQLPDLESELNQQTIQERYAEWVVCKLLDAEDESEYVAPGDLIPNKPMVMLYVANAYLQALLDDAPEMNMQLLRRFIGDLDNTIMRLEEERAQKAAAMSAPPAGADGMGAPPGPPPPDAAPMPPPAPPGPPMAA